MKVAIGSSNPVKVAAVKQAFALHFPDQTIAYKPVKVSSGVSDQPSTIKETIRGAINRAQAAASADFDYAVGMEGGVDRLETGAKSSVIELAWACVVDCKTGDYEIGSSPGFAVIPNVAQHLDAGENLNEAMRLEYGFENIGQQNGYIGWLTDDHMTRQHISYEAVYLALSTLLH